MPIILAPTVHLKQNSQVWASPLHPKQTWYTLIVTVWVSRSRAKNSNKTHKFGQAHCTSNKHDIPWSLEYDSTDRALTNIKQNSQVWASPLHLKQTWYTLIVRVWVSRSRASEIIQWKKPSQRTSSRTHCKKTITSRQVIAPQTRSQTPTNQIEFKFSSSVFTNVFKRVAKCLQLSSAFKQLLIRKLLKPLDDS